MSQWQSIQAKHGKFLCSRQFKHEREAINDITYKIKFSLEGELKVQYQYC